MSTEQQRNCRHQQFKAKVSVNRFEDSGKFMADVEVRCIDCDLPFRFLGLAAGLHFDEPRVSIDGTELHAPIEPETEKELRDRASYHMPVRPTRQ